MNTAKILIPEKEWLIKDNTKKIGSISKSKKGYNFLKNGYRIPFKTLSEAKEKLGIEFFEESIKKTKSINSDSYVIYDFPCSNKPFEPVYNVKQKLPLFSKSLKSKSKYCAGYYVIKFKKGWVKSFCPKLITLERYPYYGPFKTEQDMKNQLNKLNKNENT
jgi:hypothetical protein